MISRWKQAVEGLLIRNILQLPYSVHITNEREKLWVPVIRLYIYIKWDETKRDLCIAAKRGICLISYHIITAYIIFWELNKVLPNLLKLEIHSHPPTPQSAWKIRPKVIQWASWLNKNLVSCLSISLYKPVVYPDLRIHIL